MDIQSNLLELETAAQHLSDGLSAIQMMVLGLDGAGSPYAGALHVIYTYLSDVEREVQSCLNWT